MDRQAFLNRRAAERVNAAVVNSRAALRNTLAEPNYAAGPPPVSIPAPELLTLIRAASGTAADAPSRKLHASLFRALDDAAQQLSLIRHKGPAPADAIAAVALVARLAARWQHHQAKLERLDEARRAKQRHRVSRTTVLPQKNMGSQSVLAPMFGGLRLIPPAKNTSTAAKKHWRHRTRAEQAAMDLSAARWDAAPAPEGTEHRAQQDRRMVRLATYTAAELAEAAEIAAGRTPQPQELTMPKKQATSGTPFTTPNAPMSAGIPTPPEAAADNHGRPNTARNPSARDANAAAVAAVEAARPTKPAAQPAKKPARRSA